jgi:WD40 repeat protein
MCVLAVVVGKDGTVYSASNDDSVQSWSGEDGPHRHTISREGDATYTPCLAVGMDGTLYSGSYYDAIIQVWTHARREPRIVRTLDGHTDTVESLALSKDAHLYSG